MIWNRYTSSGFWKLKQIQSDTFLELMKSANDVKPVKPDYISVDDIFESHEMRQKNSINRDNFLGHSKYTLTELLDNIGKEKFKKLFRKGFLPREPAYAMSYFIFSLTGSLEIPYDCANYVSNLRGVIGCCDDYIDKDRYYNIYGKDLLLLSHTMLDIAEFSLQNLNPDYQKISDLILKLLNDLKAGEAEKDIFKKSYPQGNTFAKIAGLFSKKDDIFKEKIEESAGYYDLGCHILGEILDFYAGERNYLSENNKTVEAAIEETLAAYEKAFDSCPESPLKHCIEDETEMVVLLVNSPYHTEMVAESRAKKRKLPEPQILEKVLAETRKSQMMWLNSHIKMIMYYT